MVQKAEAIRGLIKYVVLLEETSLILVSVGEINDISLLVLTKIVADLSLVDQLCSRLGQKDLFELIVSQLTYASELPMARIMTRPNALHRLIEHSRPQVDTKLVLRQLVFGLIHARSNGDSLLSIFHFFQKLVKIRIVRNGYDVTI